MTRRLRLLTITFISSALTIFLTSLILILRSDDGFWEIKSGSWWEIQSIDTVKYSRDLAREKLRDVSFDETIEAQVTNIAFTGATHVALGTPYDQEFIPFLTRWVSVAREHNLKVWFRGNFSGWEGWFGYQHINREEHLSLLKEFILANGELFEDGDIFSACSECENGGPGDPRRNGDIQGHREFLVNEYKVAKEAFRKIGKNVRANFAPMNGDVARLIMDRDTTQRLGGIVVIDHYVTTPQILTRDIAEIAGLSEGKVFLGEFGVPIPGIHGGMTENEQAAWVQDALSQLSERPELVGLNYWVSYGGTTKLWESNDEPRTAVFALVNYFKPKLLTGKVSNEIGMPVVGAKVILGSKSFITRKDGYFEVAYVLGNGTLTITADGYKNVVINNFSDDRNIKITLVKEKETVLFKIYKFIY